MSKDLVQQVIDYHDALNRFDFDAVEKMFAENAEYHSSGIGGVYGRSAILQAMRAYFNEFSDQVSADDSVEVVGDSAVRSHWKLEATTKSSGRKVKRQGTETVHFNDKGLIAMLEVEDVEPI
jgi:ketosteroid isomerase-like protein